MKRYLVFTHLGVIPTVAKSAARALSNVRFRLFGNNPAREFVRAWTVKEA